MIYLPFSKKILDSNELGRLCTSCKWGSVKTRGNKVTLVPALCTSCKWGSVKTGHRQINNTIWLCTSCKWGSVKTRHVPFVPFL